MTAKETELATVGSKKAVELAIFNSDITLSTKRQGHFYLVVAGSCPHGFS